MADVENKKKSCKNVYTCSVLNCKIKSSELGISFHQIPRYDANVREEWIRRCNITKKIHNKIYVCSAHFMDSDFFNVKDKGLKRLKKYALPSIFVPTETTESKKKFVPKLLRRNSSLMRPVKHPASNEMHINDVNSNEIEVNVPDCSPKIIPDLVTIPNKPDDPTSENVDSKVNQSKQEPQIYSNRNCVNTDQLGVGKVVQESQNGYEYSGKFDNFSNEPDDKVRGLSFIETFTELNNIRISNSNDDQSYQDYIQNLKQDRNTNNGSTVMDEKTTKKKKLGHWCSVPECKFNKQSSLHKFPKDPELRKKWGIVCKIGKKITDNMRVCSAHFRRDDYMPRLNPKHPQLCKNKVIIPSLNLPKGSCDKVLTEVQLQQIKNRKERLKKRQSSKSIRNNLGVKDEQLITEIEKCDVEVHEDDNILKINESSSISQDISNFPGSIKSVADDTRTCCIPKCSAWINEGEYFLQAFPQDCKLKQQWRDICNIEKGLDHPLYVCNDHFIENDFLTSASSRQKILKSTAVPSKNILSQLITKSEITDRNRNKIVGYNVKSKPTKELIKNISVSSNEKYLPQLSQSISKNISNVILNKEADKDMPTLVKAPIILKRKELKSPAENIKCVKKQRSEDTVQLRSIPSKLHKKNQIISKTQDSTITLLNIQDEVQNKMKEPFSSDVHDAKTTLKPRTPTVTLCYNCNKFCKIEDEDILSTNKDHLGTLAVETLLELQEVNLPNENERIILAKKGIEICDKAIRKENIHLMNLLTTDDELVSFTGINFVLLDKLSKLVSQFECGAKKIHADSIKNRIAMCLCKLHINISFKSLAMLFETTPQICATNFFAMLRILSKLTAKLIYWPKTEELMKDLPECFQSFKQTRLILTCTETQIEKQRCSNCREKMVSENNGYESVKLCLGIAPSGLIIFKSKVFDGQAADNSIFTQTNILEQLDPVREAIMADKSLNIETECAQHNITLIKLPKIERNKLLSNNEVQHVKNISAARIHVDRTLQRFKAYKILQNKINWRIIPYIDDICAIIAGIVNLKNPIPPDLTQFKLSGLSL